MSDINVTMDISDVINKSERLSFLNKQQMDQLKELQRVSTNFNRAGKESITYIDQQISSNERLLLTLKNTEKGWEAVSATVKKTKSSLDALASTQVEQKIQALNARLRQALNPINDKLIAVDPSLNLERNNNILGITRRISELGVKANLTSKEVLGLFQRFEQGKLTNADLQFGKILNQFTKIQQEINKQKIDANKTFGSSSPFFNDFPPNRNNGNLPPSSGDNDRARQYLGTLQKIAISLNYFLIYKGFNFVSQQLSEAISNAKQFQIQISLIRTISQDNQLSFGRWSEEIRKVSDAIGTDFSDTAKAFYDSISNQITRGLGTAKFVKQAGELARTTNSTLQDSVNLLSSAINVYGFDVSDAESISAKFFKTIDLGRIVASDLSNTFGRVGFVAKDLGVNFDEVLAILSTLTRRGITTDDAITLLTNGMNKLTKPTEATQALLRSWGFATGEAAVRSLGFTQVLTKMIEAAESGQVSIAELFNEIRGEKFIRGTKNALSDVNSDLQKIRDESLGTFRRAKEIRGESDADLVAKQLNQLKNALIGGFGDQILGITKSVIEFTGGVDGALKSIKTLTNFLAAGVAAYAAYRTAVLASAIATTVLQAREAGYLATLASSIGLRSAATASVGANTAATQVNTVATTANATAWRLHPIGLIAGIFAAASAYIASSSVQVGGFNEKLADLDQIIKQVKEKTKDSLFQNAFDNADQIRNKAEKGLQSLSALSARTLGQSTQKLDEIRAKSSKTADALKNSFGSYVDTLRNRISDIAKEFNAVDDRVKRSTRSVIDFTNKLDEIRFGVQQRFATDEQILPLLDNQINQLRSKAATLFKQGTEESVAEARQVFDEVAKLQEERFTKEIEIRKKNLEQFYEEERRQGRQTPDRATIFVDISELQRKQNALLAERNKLENDYVKQQKELKVEKEKQLIAEKDRLRQAEDAIEDLNKLKIFDEAGKVLPKFKDQVSGKVDFKKVEEEFKSIRERLFKFGDLDTFQKLGIDTQLQERLKNVRDQIEAAQSVEQNERRQQLLTQAIENNNKAFADGKKSLREYESGVQATSKSMETLLENLKSFTGKGILEALRNKFAEENTAFPELEAKNQEEFRRFKALIEDIDPRISKLQERIKNLGSKTIEKDGIKIIDPKELAAVQEEINLVTQAVQSIVQRAFGREDVINTSIQGSKPFNDTLQALAALNQQFNENISKFNQGVNNFDSLKKTTEDISKLTGETAARFTDLQAQAALAGAGAAAGLTPVQSKLESIESVLDRVIQKLQAVQSAQAAANDPERRAYGGPIGSDNRAFYAKGGEFVMNQDATKEFYSQISAMNNRGRTQTHFASGGYVDVGGINVTVNESRSGQMTGREVARHLRREFRRGNMR